MKIRVRRTEKSPTGKRVLAVGARGGYWPCIKTPFFQFVVGTTVVSLEGKAPEQHPGKGGRGLVEI